MTSAEDSPAREQSRRELLARMGTGLVAITVDTAFGQVTPARARASGTPLRNLDAAEGRTLEALGNVLLPGAAEAGIVHFVDDQLSRENPLLLLKYLDFTTAYADFYRQGLRGVERVSQTRFETSFPDLKLEQKTELVREISQQNPPNWTGPPAPLFFFVIRNDAVDVCYGTPQGFEKLGIPYMAHILPPQKW